MTRSNLSPQQILQEAYDEANQALRVSGTSHVLASQRYYPAATDVASTSATFADIDATNVAVTFTAPASGKVVIRAAMSAETGASTNMQWNLRDGSGDVAETEQTISFGAISLRGNGAWRLSGLTPGQSYTYKVGIARTSGSNTCRVRMGVGHGSVIITAESCP